jgi:hypothetical protein
MVDVRVRKDDGIDARQLERQGGPVPFAKALHTLKQPAVHQDVGRPTLDKVPRSRNRSGRAGKGNSHEFSV